MAPHVAGVAALYLLVPGNANASAAAVSSAIIDNATTGVVGDPGGGSPNRLLYSLFAASPPPEDAPPTNSPATAPFAYSCGGLTCDFDGSESFDSDGPIVSYAWVFGDGTTSSGIMVSNTHASAGTRTVTLTIHQAETSSARVGRPLIMRTSQRRFSGW